METSEVWVAYRTSDVDRARHEPDRTLATLLIVGVGTPLAMAAAYGAFGLALQLLGIVLFVPLVFPALALAIGAPWIGLMWLGACISYHVRRGRRDKL